MALLSDGHLSCAAGRTQPGAQLAGRTTAAGRCGLRRAKLSIRAAAARCKRRQGGRGTALPAYRQDAPAAGAHCCAFARPWDDRHLTCLLCCATTMEEVPGVSAWQLLGALLPGTPLQHYRRATFVEDLHYAFAARRADAAVTAPPPSPPSLLPSLSLDIHGIHFYLRWRLFTLACGDVHSVAVRWYPSRTRTLHSCWPVTGHLRGM